jgi:hypothetical protein
MTLLREIGVAARMVIVTLWLQSAGLAALIHWSDTPLPVMRRLGRIVNDDGTPGIGMQF